ncbi:MAG: hypothetical protein HY755_08855 [Nitrospirae bacterium]|nr:hypothetical protein [Nitrospirota bacterium]
MKKDSIVRKYIITVSLVFFLGEGILWVLFVSQLWHRSEIRQSLAFLSIGQLVVLVAVLWVMYFLFQKRVGRPIEILGREIKKVMTGQMDVKIQGFEKNELGDIAEGLGFFIDRLNFTTRKLRAISDSVSMAMVQLTLTFKSVTQGMQQQVGAIHEMMNAIRQANESHKNITENTDKLISSSTENVTSLLEIKASAEEIAMSTDRLFQVTESAYSTVAEISQTAKTIMTNTDETFSAVEDTSAAMDEMNSSVKEVESVAKESASLSSQVTKVASEVGMITIVDAVEAMEKISAEVQRSSEIITQLGKRSADIENILSVIKDVTEKTNLLSLNAAILAAQAGEYGKSFSVVADEIRALSDRTASSTKNISSIIKTIQTDISEAIKTTDSGMKRVEEGNAMVYKVGDALREMLLVAEKSDSTAHTIEKATEEQAKGLIQVSLAMENIKKMMHQNKKATQEEQRVTTLLLDSVSTIKEAADIAKRGTEESAVGIRMITKNIELADGQIKEIGQATANQQKINEIIMKAVERIDTIGITTKRSVEELSMSLSTLNDEIELLKKEIDAPKTINRASGGSRT